MAIASPLQPEQAQGLPAPSKQASQVTLIVVSALVAAAYVPLLWNHGASLWARPHYQFFPMIFVGAAVLAWKKLRTIASIQPGTAWVSWSLVTLCWLLLAAAEERNSAWLGAVSFLFLILAVIYTAGGRSLVGSLLPAWLYLWLFVPPPFDYDKFLVLALQQLTTQWSSALLDLFRIYHVVAGNVVEIGTDRFFVEEACTGINSLFSVLACTLFYVLFTKPSVMRSLLLILAAIAWVLLANVARVFLVVYLAKQWKLNVAEGWRHDVLGFSLFTFALFLIWSTDRLLVTILPSRKRPMVAPDIDVADKPSHGKFTEGLRQLRSTWLTSRIAGTAFGLLLLAHLLLYALPAATLPPIDHELPDRLSKDSLPQQIDGWKRGEPMPDERRNPGSAYGEYAKRWRYYAEAQAATFALDYPFTFWHDLEVCYKNQGWEVDKRKDETSTAKGTPTFYCTRTLKKTGHRTAYLFFCEFDHAGRVIEPVRAAGLVDSVFRRESALKRLQSWFSQSDPTEQFQDQVGTLFQFQLLLESSSPLSDSELAKARDRFFLAYGELHRQMFSTSP